VEEWTEASEGSIQDGRFIDRGQAARWRVDHCTVYSPRKVGSAGPVM
jgi:hypothetical protein